MTRAHQLKLTPPPPCPPTHDYSITSGQDHQDVQLPLEQLINSEYQAPSNSAPSAGQAAQSSSSQAVTYEACASKTPKVRFNGFDEPWGQHQLRDVAQIIGGGTPSTAIDAYWYGTINWFTPAELGNEVFLSHSERKITQLALKQSSTKLLPKGTVLFTSRAGIGKTAILANESATNQGFQSIVPNQGQLDSYFIFSCSGLLKSYGESVGGGSTFKEVSGKQMGALALFIPPLEEQQRIGSLFKELDRNISLNRALLDKLTKLKTSLLEQMFPRVGESVPQLRFDGFSADWAKYSLGELGQTISGIAFPEDVQGGSEGIPFFMVSDMNLKGNETVMHMANNYVTLDLAAKQNWRPITAPAIFFAKVGAAVFLNRKRLVLSPFLLDSHTMAYPIDQNKIDCYFALALFEQIYLPKLVQNGALPSYNAGDVSSLKIMLPSLAEQQRIGGFFKAMDERIAQQRAKLSKLEQLKQALLEQMFMSASV